MNIFVHAFPSFFDFFFFGLLLVALLRISAHICLSVLAPVFLLSQRTQINGGGEKKKKIALI